VGKTHLVEVCVGTQVLCALFSTAS
jgi:hypothetical protein